MFAWIDLLIISKIVQDISNTIADMLLENKSICAKFKLWFWEILTVMHCGINTLCTIF